MFLAIPRPGGEQDRLGGKGQLPEVLLDSRLPGSMIQSGRKEIVGSAPGKSVHFPAALTKISL